MRLVDGTIARAASLPTRSVGSRSARQESLAPWLPLALVGGIPAIDNETEHQQWRYWFPGYE